MLSIPPAETSARCSSAHGQAQQASSASAARIARSSQASTSSRCQADPNVSLQHKSRPATGPHSQRQPRVALQQPMARLAAGDWLKALPDKRLTSLYSCLAALSCWQAIVPAKAGAAESLSLDFLQSWLDSIDALGPLGPFFFVTSVAAAEMIPLFPTQPLSLAGGIAFGAAKGSVLVLSANLTAGLLSFTLARTIGRQLAQKVIQEEVGEGEGKAGVRAALQKVEDTIESGTFAQQCTSILLLRLTPIVPFSASNYLLGLTPLQYPPFIVGSVGGMAVWAVIYASIGGAGRTLLQSGVSLNDVFAGIQADLGAYTEDAAVFALCAGLAVLAWQGAKLVKSGQPLRLPGPDEDDPDKVAHAKK